MVRLGDGQDPEKAGVLIAWARRDATQVIEASGAVLGALLGLTGALLLSSRSRAGATVIVMVAYGGLLGAALGALAALPVYRRLFPNSGLQPVIDDARARLLRRVTSGLVGLGVVSIAVSLTSHLPLEVRLRRWLGALWSMLTPNG